MQANLSKFHFMVMGSSTIQLTVNIHGLSSITYQGAKLENSLSEDNKGAEAVGQFQSFINRKRLCLLYVYMFFLTVQCYIMPKITVPGG